MHRSYIIFHNIYYPEIHKRQRQRAKREKPSVLGPATPSHTDLKWSPIIDQFQLCLEQTSPFIHVLWSLPVWPDCTSKRRETPPPWQDKMKEDGRAIRFLDRRSGEPTLWMVMDCLDAQLPPHLVLFILRAPRAPLLTPRSWGLFTGRPTVTVFGSPWWSRVGPITVRSEVISTAPFGCTQRELRGGGKDKRAL